MHIIMTELMVERPVLRRSRGRRTGEGAEAGGSVAATNHQTRPDDSSPRLVSCRVGTS